MPTPTAIGTDFTFFYPRPKGANNPPVLPSKGFYVFGTIAKALQSTHLVATVTSANGSKVEANVKRNRFQPFPRDPLTHLWAIRIPRGNLDNGDAIVNVAAYKNSNVIGNSERTVDLNFASPIEPTFFYPESGHPITGDDLYWLPCLGEYTAPDDVDLLTLTYPWGSDPAHKEYTAAVSELDGSWWGIFFDIYVHAPSSVVDGTIVASGAGVPSGPLPVKVYPT